MALHRTLLLVVSACLFVLGVVMIFNTTSAEVLDQALDTSTHTALFRQIVYGIFGCWFAAGIWLLGHRPFIALSPYLLAFGALLLILVFVPGIGRAANGSHRWIGFAGVTVQPSEFVKFLLPAFFILQVTQKDPDTLTFWEFVRICLPMGIPLALILLAPDHGTVGVAGVTLAMLCFLTGVPRKYWALPLVVCAVLGCVVAVNTPYVRARLEVYLNPELDLLGKGHQPYQAKIAAGSGGLLGKGPGQSWQKLSYLPEAQNDYIAAIYAEEFGFLGILLMIMLYMLMAYAGCVIAARAPDKQGCYLAASVTFLFAFQAFMNLGVVSGLLPSTGLNLPLFSQGGSSLIANLMGLGLLLSVAETPRSELSSVSSGN